MSEGKIHFITATNGFVPFCFYNQPFWCLPSWAKTQWRQRLRQFVVGAVCETLIHSLLTDRFTDSRSERVTLPLSTPGVVDGRLLQGPACAGVQDHGGFHEGPELCAAPVAPPLGGNWPRGLQRFALLQQTSEQHSGRRPAPTEPLSTESSTVGLSSWLRLNSGSASFQGCVLRRAKSPSEDASFQGQREARLVPVLSRNQIEQSSLGSPPFSERHCVTVLQSFIISHIIDLPNNIDVLVWCITWSNIWTSSRIL